MSYGAIAFELVLAVIAAFLIPAGLVCYFRLVRVTLAGTLTEWWEKRKKL